MRLRALRRWLPGPGKPLGLALTVFLVGASLLTEGHLEIAIRNSLFDAYQRSFPRTRVNDSVVIVEIDDRSLAELGQWPWPHALVARLITRLADAQPAAIAIDAVFPEPDRLSPKALTDLFTRDGYPEAAAAMARLPDSDDRLAQAMHAAPTVLGVGALSEKADIIAGREYHAPVQEFGGSAVPFVHRYAASLRSIDAIDAAAIGHGAMNRSDSEEVARRVPALVAIGDKDPTLLPGLALETLRVAVGAPPLRVRVDESGVTQIGVGPYIIHTDADAQWWVHFSDRLERPRVSAAAILHGEIDDDVLAGHIAMIGYSALGLQDIVATPVGPMPGVEVHAEAIENVLDGRLLSRPWWAPLTEAGLLAALALLAVASVPRLRPPLAIALGVGVVALSTGAGLLLFLRYGWLIDTAGPTIAAALVLAAMLSSSLAQAETQKRRLREALVNTREAQARLEGELDAARRIQMGMLPQAAGVMRGESRAELAALMQPARTVGGDLYDCFLLEGSRLYFMVGDVSGKALPASLFMMLAKTHTKAAARKPGADAGSLLTEAARRLAQDNPEQLFVTMLAGMLDLGSGELGWCSAGHDAPWLLRADGSAQPLTGTGGPPLCVIDGFEYVQERTHLAPGDMICLVTDGVGEAQNAAGELFGAQRLADCMHLAAATRSAQGTVDLLRQAVLDFTGGADLADDVTLLAVRWHGSS